MEFYAPGFISSVIYATWIYLANIRLTVGLKYYGSAMIGVTILRYTMDVMGQDFISHLLMALLVALYFKSREVIEEYRLYNGLIY